MTVIEQAPDTILFAKELANNLDSSTQLVSQENIIETGKLMTQLLHAREEDVRVMMGVNKLYPLPNYDFELELMTELELATTVIGESVVKARIAHFSWLASVSFTGFGVQLYGVDFVEPRRRHVANAFAPLEDIEQRLVA